MLRRLPRRLTPRPISVFLGTLLAGVACSSGGTDGPNNQGTVALTLGSSALSINIGSNGALSLAITRGGGFTGAVSLAVSGLAAGVSGAFAPTTIPENTTAAALNLTISATATPGVTTLTITASGSGVTSQTATLQLTLVQPTIALALTPPALSVTAGQTGTSSVGITRSSGYSGSVTLALDAPPAGIGGTFTDSPTTSATASLAITVASTVTAGQYNVVIRGTAPGAADKTVTLTLTVVAAGPVGFTVQVDPAEFDLPAGNGWSANGIVAIQRTNGFTGPVTVKVDGLGFPAAAVPSPVTIAANATATNLVTLVVAGAAPGVYSGTVKVSGQGFGDQTVPVTVRVSLPSTGSITWNFCRADRVPKYFAVRDGDGAWKHIVPDGPAGATQATPAKFSFDVGSPRASIAMVWLGEKTSGTPLIEGHYWNVFYYTRQEILDLAADECVSNRDVTIRQASGSVTGYQSFDALVASVGRHGLAFAGGSGPLTTSLTMQNLDAGPFDLLLTRSNFNGPGPDITVQSLVLQRGIDPAAGGAIPPIDFGATGTAPAAAPLTFANTNAETFANTMTFRTADGLNGWIAAAGYFSATGRTWFGIPNGQLLAGDLHQITATTISATARRQLIAFAHQVGASTLTFGPALAMPTVASVGGSTPWLVHASGTLSSEYTSRVSVYYRENLPDPRTMTIVATRGFLGGTNQYDLSLPDLTGVSGFTAFWNLRKGAAVKWTVTGGQGSTGDLLVDGFCTATGFCPVKPVDGTTYLSAQATGTVNVPQ